MWSGEATRSSGGNDQTRIDITIGDDSANKPKELRKERPVWLRESTIGGDYAGSVSKLPDLDSFLHLCVSNFFDNFGFKF